MSACARCGQRLPSKSAACARCAAKPIAFADPNQAYGMLELDAAGAAPAALDMLETGRASVTGTHHGAKPRQSAPERAAKAAPRKAAPPAGSAGARDRASETRVRNPATARSHAGATAANADRPSPEPQVDPNAASYGRGMMLDDDPFNTAFGAGAATASLELGAERVLPRKAAGSPAPDADQAEAPPEETPAQQRAKRIAEIAGYGPPPARLHLAPRYWFRVMTRKRVLSEELSALSVQRKQADEQASEALIRLGEALHARADEPELAPLHKQLAAVADAEARIGSAAAEGEKRSQSRAGAVSRVTRELRKAEAAAAPLIERAAQLDASLEELRARGRRADAQRRKVEAELEAIARGKARVDPERRAVLLAEREQHLGEYQSVGVQLQPLEDDQQRARAELEQKQRRIAELQGHAQTAASALERAHSTQRVSVGSAQGARQQALVSLANAALKAGAAELGDELGACAQAAIDAAARVETPRKLEELHRAATNSYDRAAYGLGFNMLIGGSVTLFVSLALAVLF